MASGNITWAAPAEGSISQQIQYKLFGSNTWTTYATVGPTVTAASLDLPAGNYDFTILSICANGLTQRSPSDTFYICSCPAGYTKDFLGNCIKASTVSANILYSNYCLASSTNSAYTGSLTRVYQPGFSNSSIGMDTPPSGEVYTEYITDDQWSSTNASTGPMNRAGVWVDTNCDGTKDGLVRGTQTTISYAFNNTGVARRMYVGIGGDNLFTLKVNGVEVAKTQETLASFPIYNNTAFFGFWHIFPVNTAQGWNYFNVIATGDGSVNDAIAMTIYDLQTPQSFDGVHTAIVGGVTQYDVNLNVLFSTSSLIGEHIDIASCPDGYSLDTSAGQGNYTCRTTDVVACG